MSEVLDRPGKGMCEQQRWCVGKLGRRGATKSQVYVIRASDSPVAKIGVSTDPERRVRQIRAMSPLRLEILWTCPGSYPLESRLHTQLGAYRSHGEWFDFQDLDPVTVVRDALAAVGAEGASGSAEMVRVDLRTSPTVHGCVCGHESRLHGAGGCTVMGWDESHDCSCTTYTSASGLDDEPSVPDTLDHPLTLNTNSRVRLERAVRVLLDAPGLMNASDPVRLAVLVLMARTPWATGLVETTSRDLGQWLGLSVSHMQSVVLPDLRHSGAVATRTLTGEFGEDRSLACEVLPLHTARRVSGNPLALSPEDLTAWQLLMEALMSPTRSPRGGIHTTAGLLNGRTGRGASTDRLALLLLVLEAAATGRVRLRGGSVDTHRGRAAATLARLLGCGLPGR